MAQAAHDSITTPFSDPISRRFTLAAAAAAVIAPQVALAGTARTSIEVLWALRPALVARRERAADVLEALGNDYEDGDPRETEYETAHGAVWGLDEQIMLAPVTTSRDLAIKALLVRERCPDELGDEPLFLQRLADDAVALAALST